SVAKWTTLESGFAFRPSCRPVESIVPADAKDTPSMPSLDHATSRGPQTFTRRQMIRSLGGGLGGVALAALLGEAQAQKPHHRPRASRVIQLFMNGGPFGPDLFDPKPAINKNAGQRPKAVALRTENPTGGLMAVPYSFAKCGTSGLEISDALPRLRRH